MLAELAPKLLKTRIYHAILEANASEHSARRMAMKNASENANDLSQALNLEYNKSRQAAITNQIIEVTSGRDGGRIKNKTMATKIGKVTQIIGPVIDVDFGEESSLPPIYNALRVKLGDHEITVEVVKHLEPGKVRAISLAPTDGLERGAVATDTGKMIEVPVGEETLGNIFDVLGNPLTKPDQAIQKILADPSLIAEIHGTIDGHGSI